jgi:hypothetical protein
VAFNGDVPNPIGPKGKKVPYLYTGSGNITMGDEYSSDKGTVEDYSTVVTNPEAAVDSVIAVSTPSKKWTRENKKCQDYHKSVNCKEWLFDSGASVHVIPNKICYLTLDLSTPKSV